MVEPENLVLEHLRAIRGEMGKTADCMQTLSVEMIAPRLSGVVTFQDKDHGDNAAIKHRLDRSEWRLEFPE